MQNLLNKTYTLLLQFLCALFSAKKTLSIAIDISSGNARIVGLSLHKNSYRLEKIICEPITLLTTQNNQGTSTEKIIPHLKNIIEKNNLKSRSVAIAISYSGIIAKNITLAQPLKENEIEEFLALNIEQHINITADKISFDYRIPHTSSNSNQTTIELIAARKESVDKCNALLDSIELKTKLIDVDAYALARISNLLALDSSQLHAIANLEIEKILIVICKQNRLIYAQEYFIENHIFYDEEILSKQISNNLQLCLAAINQPVNTITLCGTHAKIHGLVESLDKVLRIKTILANPFCKMTFSEQVDKKNIMENAPAMSLCCGLAMWDKHDFNLLPWRQELHNQKQQLCKMLIGCGIILGTLLIAIWHFTLTQQINSVTAKQHKLLPQITALQQQEKQIKIANNEIAEIKTKLAKIKTLQDSQAANIALLTTLSQITPASIYLLNLQKNDDATININGQTSNLSAITEFMHRISQANLFTQAQIQEIKNISEQEHTFTITANLKHSN